MMPEFAIEYSAESLLQLKALDKLIARRILKKLTASCADPHRPLKRLKGRPEYKLRVGDYRVIADVEDVGKAIFVRSVGHRKNVYGPR